MKRKNLLTATVITFALALTVWTIGATVNLSTIGFNVSSGDVVSASEFNNAFATVDSNFADVEGAIHANRSGVAQQGAGGADFLAGGLETIEQLDITAPSDGFVVAMAAGEVYANHVNGTTSDAEIGVSNTDASLPGVQDIKYQVPSSAPTGTYTTPYSSQHIFPVTTGVNTFFVLANEISGDMNFADASLSLVFVPSEFGTVSTTSQEVRSASVDDN